MGNKKNKIRRIRSALISVSDKSNLQPLLRVLKRFDIKLISSGGTYKTIQKLNYKCIEVSDFTGFKEILNGRVKTLHPKIHAGILNKRNNKKHFKELKNNNYENIDLVIVNFYPFEKTLKQTKSHDKIIENIDNGLYFGNKNSYTTNQNIFISGISSNEVENIKWEIKKI